MVNPEFMKKAFSLRVLLLKLTEDLAKKQGDLKEGSEQLNRYLQAMEVINSFMKKEKGFAAALGALGRGASMMNEVRKYFTGGEAALKKSILEYLQNNPEMMELTTNIETTQLLKPLETHDTRLDELERTGSKFLAQALAEREKIVASILKRNPKIKKDDLKRGSDSLREKLQFHMNNVTRWIEMRQNLENRLKANIPNQSFFKILHPLFQAVNSIDNAQSAVTGGLPIPVINNEGDKLFAEVLLAYMKGLIANFDNFKTKGLVDHGLTLTGLDKRTQANKKPKGPKDPQDPKDSKKKSLEEHINNLITEITDRLSNYERSKLQQNVIAVLPATAAAAASAARNVAGSPAVIAARNDAGSPAVRLAGSDSRSPSPAGVSIRFLSPSDTDSRSPSPATSRVPTPNGSDSRTPSPISSDRTSPLSRTSVSETDASTDQDSPQPQSRRASPPSLDLSSPKRFVPIRTGDVKEEHEALMQNGITLQNGRQPQPALQLQLDGAPISLLFSPLSLRPGNQHVRAQHKTEDEILDEVQVLSFQENRLREMRKLQQQVAELEAQVKAESTPDQRNGSSPLGQGN